MKYIMEFIAVCEFLKKNNVLCKKGYLIVEREKLETMLDRNKYALSKEKLQTWKRLNWIATDPERLTKRLYQDGKYVSRIFIYEKVQQELKRLHEIEGDKNITRST